VIERATCRARRRGLITKDERVCSCAQDWSHGEPLRDTGSVQLHGLRATRHQRGRHAVVLRGARPGKKARARTANGRDAPSVVIPAIPYREQWACRSFASRHRKDASIRAPIRRRQLVGIGVRVERRLRRWCDRDIVEATARPAATVAAQVSRGVRPAYGISFALPFSKEYLGTWIHTPSSCFGSLWMRTSVTSSVPFLSTSQKSRS